VAERRVQLFITCLAEQFYPSTLRNLVRLLERQGVEVEFPAEQTCCGQPFFNTGFQDEARALARSWLRTFGRSDDPIVAPSGSCVDMVRHHFPHLFAPGSPEAARAAAVAARTFEIGEYLVHRLGVRDVGARRSSWFGLLGKDVRRCECEQRGGGEQYAHGGSFA